MRMKRISLSLPHPLSRSLSFGRTITPIGGFSSKSPKFDPESVPKKLAARHTRRPNQPLPAKKIFFLPSRDHQNLDLDAMCLDLESSRLPNQEILGRGNVASIHQHPPTHYFPFHPSHRFTSTPSIRRTPPKRSPTHPQPPNLATSQKTKNAGQTRKGWRTCSRIGFLRQKERAGLDRTELLDRTADTAQQA